MENKNIFIGIDLSFNSTGITFYNQFENKIRFYRVAYKDQTKKINQIPNVNLVKYSMPTNILTSSVCNMSDQYSVDQFNTTLKEMVCIKKIIEIVGNYLKQYKQEKLTIHLNVEGFIGSTPNFNTITGLIMLQGQLRADLIKMFLQLNVMCKLKVTSPTKLKKFFTGNGDAEKIDMINSFFKLYDGKKLINTSPLNMEINDVVDSFALMCMSVAEHFGLLEYKAKVIKPKKKNGTTTKRKGIIVRHGKLEDIITPT